MEGPGGQARFLGVYAPHNTHTDTSTSTFHQHIPLSKCTIDTTQSRRGELVMERGQIETSKVTISGSGGTSVRFEDFEDP